MFSFMEAGPPRSPMIFLEGKSGSSHSNKSSFMEEKLWAKVDESAWGGKGNIHCFLTIYQNSAFVEMISLF